MIATEKSVKPLINFYLEIEHTLYRLQQLFDKQENKSGYSDSKQREISILQQCLCCLRKDPIIDLWEHKKRYTGLLGPALSRTKNE